MCGKQQLHKKLDRRQVGTDFKMFHGSSAFNQRGKCLNVNRTNNETRVVFWQVFPNIPGTLWSSSSLFPREAIDCWSCSAVCNVQTAFPEELERRSCHGQGQVFVLVVLGEMGKLMFLINDSTFFLYWTNFLFLEEKWTQFWELFLW